MQIAHPDPRVVLIAETDHNVRELQLFFLDRSGFTVEFADDGQGALVRARLLRPHLVITEILIPKLDGLTLCRRLRDEPATAGTPVLVFSILSAATRAAEAGANAYLRKPLIESTFVTTVQDLIAAQPTSRTETHWA